MKKVRSDALRRTIFQAKAETTEVTTLRLRTTTGLVSFRRNRCASSLLCSTRNKFKCVFKLSVIMLTLSGEFFSFVKVRYYNTKLTEGEEVRMIQFENFVMFRRGLFGVR